MEVGFIGLGKMGKNMVSRLLSKGAAVVVYNRSEGPVNEAVKSGATAAVSLEELVSKLRMPRVIWLMLPAGAVIDKMLDGLLRVVSDGDLLVDGGNSFYEDTKRRSDKLSKMGIHYMDVGVSGGPSGALSGACLMAGGTEEDFLRIEPLLKMLSAPSAYGYLGGSGAGHFAKMVHNGIEYGMMQAIAEGAAILKNSQFQFNLAEIFRLYNSRSVIESRLVAWAREALLENPDLSGVSSKISATGEGEWSVETAQKEGVSAPVIEAALRVRQESQVLQESKINTFRNKFVSALRGKFGQHKVK